MLTEQEKLDRLRLIRTDNVGPVTFHALLEKFGSAARALEALPELAKRGGARKNLRPCPKSSIEKEWAAGRRLNAKYIFYGEQHFPRLLAQTDPPPPAIVTLGHTHLLDNKSISIVGSRNASANAIKLTTNIAHDLGASEYTIVSGMARGIDTAAHRGALESGTIAVLAGGVDSIYPPENEELYHSIINRGCIVSEMPMGHTARAKDFPRRNRLVSGLSLATVVAEAALRSGSLITARMANEQSREVFAIPGSPLDPRSRGCNGLIKQGATLIESARDILECLETLQQFDFSEPKDPYPVHTTSSEEADTADHDEEVRRLRPKILRLMGPDPTEIDDLIRLSSASPAVVHTVLLELDLAGRLQRVAGHKVSLII